MATKLKVKTKDGEAPLTVTPTPGKSPLVDLADGRDILSMFVGAGHTSLGNKDVQNHFNRLSQIVGAPLAQKLTNQAFLYNQRPDVQKLTPEQRVQNFFSLGSNDTDVAGYLNRSRTLGMGQLQGFRTSPLIGNSILQGKDVGDVNAPESEAARKIKLVVKK